ncbi:MAG: LapA family protein [Magnetococcales bacterium]|nr:LapA family protein [Magnetococcales bacterium]NGZ26845.1 LapA family protein [Magnetococcales bacterium]
MARLVASLILAILLLIFASQNMHAVSVRLVFGSPVELPMIMVISGAFVAGFAVATFVHIVQAARRKKSDTDDEDF